MLSYKHLSMVPDGDIANFSNTIEYSAIEYLNVCFKVCYSNAKSGIDDGAPLLSSVSQRNIEWPQADVRTSAFFIVFCNLSSSCLWGVKRQEESPAKL